MSDFTIINDEDYVFELDDGPSETGLFESLMEEFMEDHELTDNLEEADIVMITGGEDVDPSLSGCEKHPATYSKISRDLEEKAVFEKVRSDQLCVGICRGLRIVGSR